ncbi:MAG: chemotaxis response regulator protein-glutamate methylesterase [Burkholderiaceae bacterium]
MAGKIYRVLIVDDSKAMCHFLAHAINQDPQLEVVGVAHDPYEARGLIKQVAPDVITLDVEMPKMDGITFLGNLMRLRPMPVVMISSLTTAGAQTSLEALRIGAVDFMVKRQPASEQGVRDYISEICDIVRTAAQADVTKSERKGSSAQKKPEFAKWKERAIKGSAAAPGVRRLINIGASTGGPEALRNVLDNTYSPDCAVTITQHMPTRFMGPFADRLNQTSRYKIALANDGEVICPGHAYVAPGDFHMDIVKQGGKLICKLREGQRINGHMPAVDFTFTSAANAVGDSCLGILLTGMGNDGAQGLKDLHDAGAMTIAQDERSSAVWGMPGSAVAMGAADAVLTLADIGPTLDDLLGPRKSAPAKSISEIASGA